MILLDRNWQFIMKNQNEKEEAKGSEEKIQEKIVLVHRKKITH